MKQRIAKSLTMVLGVLFLCVMAIFCGQGEISAFAEESTQNELANVDYTAQNYTDIPDGFNVANEDVIYKLSCKNPRSQVDTSEEYLEEYVTVVSFRASMGCQIYFVDGKACMLEDADSLDHEWDEYANYYDILHYDETNQFVYLKFKNLENLDTDESVDGAIADMRIWLDRTTYNSAPQYIYISNIVKPVTEITSDDAFFSTEMKAGAGAFYPTGYNIYSVEYVLKINQKVSHLVDKIDVSFIAGGTSFTLYESSFTVDDGEGEGGYLNFECITLGDESDITTPVQIQAVITYGDKTITARSGKTDLITLWKPLVENGFSDYDYATYMSEANKSLIRGYVKAHESGFYADIKGSKYSFAAFSSSTDIKTTSLIFRAPLENFNYLQLHWGTNYYKSYTYHAYVKVDSSLTLSTSVYKMITNEDGTVTVGLDDGIETAATITHDTEVEAALLAKAEMFIYDGYVYVRVKDESMVQKYFPQNATQYFNATARNASYTSVIEANTATIIYDEYNKGLLEEIDNLTGQIEEMQGQLSDLEGKREQINELTSKLDGLMVDYNTAQNEIAYLNQQMEVMREEYQKKIDQLIAENGDKEPTGNTNTNTNTDTKPSITDTDKTSLILPFAGLMMGVILIGGLAILLSPSKKGGKTR